MATNGKIFQSFLEKASSVGLTWDATSRDFKFDDKALEIAAEAAVKNKGAVFGKPVESKQPEVKKSTEAKHSDDVKTSAEAKHSDKKSEEAKHSDNKNEEAKDPDKRSETPERSEGATEKASDESTSPRSKDRPRRKRRHHKRSKKHKSDSSTDGSTVEDTSEKSTEAKSESEPAKAEASADKSSKSEHKHNKEKKERRGSAEKGKEGQIQGILIVDQGAWDFKMTFMGRRHGEVRKYVKMKSKGQADMVDAELLQSFKDASGQDLLDTKTGVFNDCSGMPSSCYKAYCNVVAQFYSAIRDKIVFKLKQHYDQKEKANCNIRIKKVLIRQTDDKIRRVLLQPKNAGDKLVWEECMSTALKNYFADIPLDYALMTSKEESALQGTAFFNFSKFSSDIQKQDVIGVGIGGASSLVYSLDSSGNLVNNHDFNLGGLTAGSKDVASLSADSLRDQFMALFKPILDATSKKPKTTVVVLKVMGDLLADMAGASWEDHDDFANKMKEDGATFSPLELMIFSKRFSGISESYTAKFIHGFALAMNSIPTVTKLQLERKKSLGKPLPYKTSWVLSLAHNTLIKNSHKRRHHNSRSVPKGAPAPPSGPKP